MQLRHILSVGQCAADHWHIARTFSDSFAAQVVSVDTEEEVKQALEQDSFDLILVNRVLDANGHSGLDIIRDLKNDPKKRSIPVMLVSNYDDAQEEAVKLGALRGFGKAALGHPGMLALIRRVMEIPETEQQTEKVS